MALQEELSLDIGPAISSLDDLDARVTQSATTASSVLSDAINAAVDQASGLGDALADAITSGITSGADAGVAGLQDALDSISGPGDLSLDVDPSSAQDAVGAVNDLTDAEVAANEQEVTISVDTSSLDDATTQLGDLQAAEESVSETPVSVSVDSSGIDDASTGLDTFSGSATKAGASSKVTDVAAGGLLSRLQSLTPASIATAAGVAGLGLGLEQFVTAGAQSTEGTLRLNEAYGDMADKVQQIHVNGLTTDLSALTLATGSNVAGVKIAVANLGQLGTATGATSAQTVEAGQNFGALANYIAATRPELGSAEDVATRLGRALQQGGRFALSLGLPLNSTAEIADRASQKFGVTTDQLTSFQKQSAALDIVMERLGPSFKKNLDDGLNSPIVQIRAVEAALRKTIQTAGEPIAVDFVHTLQGLQPLVETLVTTLGSLAGGGLKAVGGGLEALEVPLEIVSKLIALIPGPVLAGAAAFTVGAKSYSLAYDGAARLASGIGSLLDKVRSISDVGLAGAFGDTGASAAQIEKVSASTQGFIASQEDLRTVLVTNAAASQEGSDALAAFDLVQEADQAKTEARTAVLEAQIVVEKARATAVSGTEKDLAALSAAETDLTTKTEASVAADEEAAAAKTLYAESIDAVTTNSVEGAAEIAAADEVATVANDTLASSLAEAEAASISFGAALGPIGLLLGVAAAGFAIFHSGSEQNKADLEAEKQATTDALQARQQYSDSLKLTASQSGDLNQNQAAASFVASNTAADAFQKTLQGINQDSKFDELHLNLGLAGEALSGDKNAAEDFRKSLVAAGAVKIGDSNLNTNNGIQRQDAARELQSPAFLAEGNRQLQTYIDTGKLGDHVIGDQLSGAFDKAATASQRANASILAAAQAEVTANGTAGVLGIQQAANLGLLDDLSPKEEARAKDLLDTVTATKQATEATADLAEAYGDAGSKAGSALDALTKGQKPDLSGLEELRTLAASPSFAQLPQDLQDSITKELGVADSAQKAAAAQGLLVDSNGEVTSSLVDLNSQLQTAASTYLQISGAPAQFAADSRAAAESIRDISQQTDTLGTSLDASTAHFTTGQITLDNYKSVLAVLPQATQDAINALGSGGQAADSSAAKIAQVKQALVDLHNAGQDPVKGLIDINTNVTKDNVDTIIKSLPDSIQQKIKLTVDPTSTAAVENTAKTEAAKLAATQAAVAKASGKDLTDLTTAAADNSDKLNDYFDSVGTNIRKVIADAAEQKQPLDQIQATAAQLVQNFTDTATAAGLTKDQISGVVDQQRLTPKDIELDFHSSGLDGVITQLQHLSLILLGLPPDTLAKILAIKDPTNQLTAINNAIGGLPKDKQVAVEAILDVPSTQSASSDLDALTAPRTVAITPQFFPSEPGSAPALTGSGPTQPGQGRAPTLAQFAASFPANPKVGQVAVVGGESFQWNGSAWVPVVSGKPAQGPSSGAVHAFAVGGELDGATSDAVRKRQQLGETGGLSSGKVNAGDYETIGEADSHGEYVVSTRPDQKNKNLSTLSDAANAFGLGLVPSGAQAAAAPTTILAPAADPQLLDAISSLSAAVAAHWAPVVNANITEASPAQSLEALFDRLNEMRLLGR